MRLSLALACSVLAVTSLSAQQPDNPTFRAESELVVLHVSVRDDGRYVPGLSRDAFTVIDDGEAQSLEMFSNDDVPATVGLLIDNSVSMTPSRERVVASAVAFAKHSHPEDEIFVLTFNETVRPAWPLLKIGEIDQEIFASTIARSVFARGMTAIYDGILEGLTKVGKGAHTRQVLIVVSDGDDNASKAKLDDVLREVRTSDAVIYTVALTDSLMRDGNPGLLRRLSRFTGGESFSPVNTDEVPGALERIARDIRSAYTLAYRPTAGKSRSTDEVRRRTVKVYVRNSGGKAYSVRTRDGYFVKVGSREP